MGRSWTGAEIEFLTRYIGIPIKDTVEIFNKEFEERSYFSIQKKVKILRTLTSDATEEEDETQDPILDKIGDIIGTTDIPYVNNISPSEKKKVRNDAENWLKELISSTSEIIKNIKQPTSRAIRQDKATLIVVLSDLHFGKITDKYNLEVAKERLESIPYELKKKLVNKIDEVVIAFVGDTIEGEDIYPTQNISIECPVLEQTQVVTQSSWKTILTFRKLFNCAIRIITVPGNHGRMSKTASEKSNWDNIVYYILKIMVHLNNDPDITIETNYKQFNVTNIKGHAVGLFHEGVKHTSTPAMREKIAGWVTSKGLDIIIHGHWHEWHIGNWLGRIVVSNGCLCGPDDLAEKIAKEDNARQGWFILEYDKPPYSFSFLEW